jgi:hypothetical protein
VEEGKVGCGGKARVREGQGEVCSVGLTMMRNGGSWVGWDIGGEVEGALVGW